MNGSALSGSLHSLAKMQAKWHIIGDNSKFESELFEQIQGTIHEMDAFTVTNMIWCAKLIARSYRMMSLSNNILVLQEFREARITLAWTGK